MNEWKKEETTDFDGRRVVIESWQLCPKCWRWRVKLQVQLTPEQPEFKLHGPIICGFFPINTLGPAIRGLYIHRFNQPWIEDSVSTFPFVVSLLQIENTIFHWAPQLAEWGMQRASSAGKGISALTPPPLCLVQRSNVSIAFNPHDGSVRSYYPYFTNVGREAQSEWLYLLLSVTQVLKASVLLYTLACCFLRTHMWNAPPHPTYIPQFLPRFESTQP